MNRKDIREIKKRIDKELENYRKVYGCYVNAAREVVSYIDINVLEMDQEEREMYCGVFRKLLSGTLGRNLVNIEFATDDVGNSDEHKLLQMLRMSHCGNEDMRKLLYDRIIESVEFEDTSYVILLAADTYDIPYKGEDGHKQFDESGEQFDYFLCAICPVKDSKAALQYNSQQHSFRGISTGSLLANPQLGFMFPAYDEGATNIYNALYYTRALGKQQDKFIENVFKAPHKPMAADLQMNAFSTVLADSLEEECSLDVVKVVYSNLREAVLVHKESNDLEAPELYVSDVRNILEQNGVSGEKAQAFKDNCVKQFDDSDIINPANLVETKKFVIETPEAKITIDPEHVHSLKTQVIDGRNYLMIPVGSMTVNGVDVVLGEE